jgi:hypothetical protein
VLVKLVPLAFLVLGVVVPLVLATARVGHGRSACAARLFISWCRAAS